MYRTPEEWAAINAMRDAERCTVVKCCCAPTRSVTLHAQQHGRALRSPKWYADRRYHQRRRVALTLLAAAVVIVGSAAVGALWLHVGGV